MSEGFGKDTWCTDHYRSGRFARGRVLLAQALFRRLITPRGSLRQKGSPQDDADAQVYGFDVSEYLGAVGTAVALAALPGLVEGELSKDDRVASVTIEATSTRDTDGAVHVVLSVDVTPADETEDFTFTVDVTEAGATMGLAA